MLNQRSDDLAASLLEPLSPAQRSRLTQAMADVERLLTAAMVDVAPIDPEHPDALHCLQAYFDELNHRFDGGFDPTRGISAASHELRPPAGLMLLASLRAEPIGCAALKFHDDAPAEIKRMWVAGSARGLGVGRRLLQEIEACASAAGRPDPSARDQRDPRRGDHPVPIRRLH